MAARIYVMPISNPSRAGVAMVRYKRIPHRVVIGDRGLKDGKLEYQGRRDASPTVAPLAEAAEFLTAKLCVPS